MFKLVIQDDEGKTTIVPLIRDEITIGRKEGNTIRLTERNVSRRHARILRNNGEVHIEDLGSYNGIRVNNARIAERVSLRVSDQVQIGDYKLYLKAEGHDQVDDSRTTPIERVEPGATDSMPAVNPPPAAIVTPVPSVAPMIGPIAQSGNRTMVAIADTDPGRSVGPATAAAVAAMSAPGGYGKLVVLSSNFAGKEFELSRPQMIVGRTDENDIVVNHRSISRNHAKLVREPDTGRYTISDLQSSNGVRVNGSDYGKVELRRGDVVDLGHVRLRFVEAGEDFVFARDAVITDVPEAGGRRGMLVALLAAIVVLVAVVAVYWLRTMDKHPAVAPGTAPSGSVIPDADDQVAAHTPDTTAPVATTRPTVSDDAPGSGSGSGAPAVATNPTTTTNPTTASGSAKPEDFKTKAAACAELEVAKDWQGLRDCAGELGSLGAKDKSSKDKAEEFRVKAVKETAAEAAAARLQEALRDGNLREAQKQLKAVGADSVYWSAANEGFKTAETRAVDDNRRKAQQFAQARDCAAVRRLQTQAAATSTPAVSTAVAQVALKCIDKPVAAAPETTPKPPPPGNPDVAPPTTQAKNPCDTMNVDDVMSQAANQYAAGFAKAALQLLTKALACKQDVRMYRMAGMYACAAHEAGSAKVYYAKVSAPFQPAIVQRCLQEGITIP
jgi:pSer/pThr/pTyr-binding forkhead associated (FHA) protein